MPHQAKTMSDLPRSVHIYEQGPREGFQFEKGPIPTARKIERAIASGRFDTTGIMSLTASKRSSGAIRNERSGRTTKRSTA
jgi:hypothetical protein